MKSLQQRDKELSRIGACKAFENALGLLPEKKRWILFYSLQKNY